jgi:hypothetical protein
VALAFNYREGLVRFEPNVSTNKKKVRTDLFSVYLLTYLVGLDDGIVFAAENPIVATSFVAS